MNEEISSQSRQRGAQKELKENRWKHDNRVERNLSRKNRQNRLRYKNTNRGDGMEEWDRNQLDLAQSRALQGRDEEKVRNMAGAKAVGGGGGASAGGRRRTQEEVGKERKGSTAASLHRSVV